MPDDPIELHVADEPDDDGLYLLFFLRNGATVKCGYVYADAEEDVRRGLRRP